eukprot:GHVP01048288.1.p1 GENE.GHVP01048288.1~~GHVP01048288.1.p1  ORF type:complete len:418 (+),score=89.99 GHVP01048288.1:24-1277(+)
MAKKKSKKLSDQTVGTAMVKAHKQRVDKIKNTRNESFMLETQLEKFEERSEMEGRSDFTSSNRETISPCYVVFRKQDINREDIIIPETIPKKPVWSEKMTVEEYKMEEERMFFEWKKELQEIERMTQHRIKFERNLIIWKQLWHTIEKGNVILQILDIRNPLLYFSEELIDYSREICPKQSESAYKKCSIIILNKADLVDQAVIGRWKNHFEQMECVDAVLSFSSNINVDKTSEGIYIDGRIIDEISRIRRSIFEASPSDKTIVGITGYPNVGKSSFINSIFSVKRVGVSRTPGKTKHIQTLNYGADTVVIDCPGVVIPSKNITEADSVLGGLESISTSIDYKGALNKVFAKLGAEAIRAHYGLKDESKTEDPMVEFLTDYSAKRKWYCQGSGVADEGRVARMVLRDIVEGSLAVDY